MALLNGMPAADRRGNRKCDCGFGSRDARNLLPFRRFQTVDLETCDVLYRPQFANPSPSDDSKNGVYSSVIVPCRVSQGNLTELHSPAAVNIQEGSLVESSHAACRSCRRLVVPSFAGQVSESASGQRPPSDVVVEGALLCEHGVAPPTSSFPNRRPRNRQLIPLPHFPLRGPSQTQPPVEAQTSDLPPIQRVCEAQTEDSPAFPPAVISSPSDSATSRQETQDVWHEQSRLARLRQWSQVRDIHTPPRLFELDESAYRRWRRSNFERLDGDDSSPSDSDGRTLLLASGDILIPDRPPIFRRTRDVGERWRGSAFHRGHPSPLRDSVAELLSMFLRPSRHSEYTEVLRLYGRGGLCTRDLENLPISIFNNSGGAKTCQICLEEIENCSQVRWLPCLHGFHPGCIDRWLGKSKFCPICKCDVLKAMQDTAKAF